MDTARTLPLSLTAFLQCPVCSQPLHQLQCHHCQSTFFEFGGIPCLLPAGRHQKAAWQHQLAELNQRTEHSSANLTALLERYDILPATRERAENAYDMAQASSQIIQRLLAEAGLEAQFHPHLAQASLGSLSEYYHHILQDWAWDNQLIMNRVAHALSVCDLSAVPSMLVLGAGAGRLSWELHQAFNVGITIASDINPLLLTVANKLIRHQQAFDFIELNSFPQIGKDISQKYLLQPPSSTAAKRENWFAMAADVWHMPIKPQSLDLIVTSWFIDVHGGDNRDLLPRIKHWLKPGGIWLNSGPLLYPRTTAFEQKYGREELIALMTMAGLRINHERLDEQIHLHSPINVRSQTEQVWSFSATALSSEEADLEYPQTSSVDIHQTPPWLILHHLPIPKIFSPPKESHPLIELVLSQVDGNRGIDQICVNVAASMPQGIDIKGAVTALFGELLESIE